MSSITITTTEEVKEFSTAESICTDVVKYVISNCRSRILSIMINSNDGSITTYLNSRRLYVWLRKVIFGQNYIIDDNYCHVDILEDEYIDDYDQMEALELSYVHIYDRTWRIFW